MGSPQHLQALKNGATRRPDMGGDHTQAVIDSMQAHIAIIDRRGEITAVNQAWAQFARTNGDPHLDCTGIGINYLTVLARAMASDKMVRRAYEGTRFVLQGRTDVFSIEYPCHSPTEEMWFRMVASPLRLKSCGAVLAHYDITELHAAQSEREALIAELPARNAALEKEQTLLQQELARLEKHAHDHQTGITSHLYGAGLLRDVAPQAFDQLFADYTDLLQRALELRAYRIDTDLSDPLQALAEQIGFLNGGPRDIIDLHSEGLKELLTTVQGLKAQALTDEARLMLVKLLCYLAAYYRRYAVNN